MKVDKGDFSGRDALRQIKERGAARKLVGLIASPGSTIAPPKSAILVDGREIGYITAMVASPTLGYPIALGYVPPSAADIGTELTVGAAKDGVKMKVAPTPFYDPSGSRLRL